MTLVAAVGAALFSVILAWPEAGTAVNAAPATGERFACTVTKVHDGDGPIWCAEGPRIPLTAIAAPELDETCSPGHPCPAASGATAQQALQRLAFGGGFSDFGPRRDVASVAPDPGVSADHIDDAPISDAESIEGVAGNGGHWRVPGRFAAP